MAKVKQDDAYATAAGPAESELRTGIGGSGARIDAGARFEPIIPVGILTPTIDILQLRSRRIALDPVASRAVTSTAADNSGAVDRLRRLISEQGLSARISAVTERLNKTGLDELVGILLTQKAIYAGLLLNALEKPTRGEGIPPQDTDGLVRSVLRNVQQDPRVRFFTNLVDEVQRERMLGLDEPVRTQLIQRLVNNGAPLTAGRTVASVLKTLDGVRQDLDGMLPSFVDDFLTQRGEIDAAGAAPRLREAMISHLRRMKLKIDPSEFANGAYDEYFAIAYDRALNAAEGGDDPIDTFRRGSGLAPTTWNFQVDTFDAVEEQGVIKENILAAGALAYVFDLGEQLGVYRLADALILRWAGGGLDVPQGPTADRMYRYYKLRDERSSPEERAMLYKRVLDVGDANMLSGAVANTDFPSLWERLMREAADYIQKVSEAKDGATSVSRLRIYSATRELQYNLSGFMTGMAHLQVTEMYAHLREAFELLGAPEVVDQLAGGFRRNMWTVIERLAREEFNAAPNVSALRTVAVEGNRVFQWIARFDQGSVQEDEFRQFLDSAEAYIIAQSDATGLSPVDEDVDDESEEPQDGEFDDWDN